MIDRELRKEHNQEQAELRKLQEIQKERENVEARIENRSKEELARLSPQSMGMLRQRFRLEYHDCPNCGWPGRKTGEGCLRCSDGF